MHIANHITDNFTNLKKLNHDYVKNPPYPNIGLDNFIPQDTVSAMKEECNNLDWTREFTRAGSYMKERMDVEDCPVALNVQQQLSSKKFMTWLGKLTGHPDLVPDPHMVGAGYMRSGRGHSLKIHSDFNWNNTIKLWRLISMTIYLNKDWQEEWNGDLQFYDFDRTKCIKSYYPEAGRAVIWRHHKYGFHGHPNPMQCPEGVYRDGFRMFYYVSEFANVKTDDSPHRSLYYYDEKTKTPYDIPEEK